MRASQILTILTLVLGLSVGQVLLKLAADQIAAGKGEPLWLRAASNGYLLGACVLYGVAMIAWVWVLSGAQLSRAYPFVALSFLFTPLLALVVLKEPLTRDYVIGVACIVTGLYFVQKH